MLAAKLQHICKQRGITVVLSPAAPFFVCDNGSGAFIERWDESVLGPRPTQAEIDAVDTVALQAEIAAKEAATADRILWHQTKARELVRELIRHVKAIEAVVKVKFPNVTLPTWDLED